MRDVISLYRHLLRQVKALPRPSHEYYKGFIRQHYRSHSDETDPERIQGMIARAHRDAAWIVNKYSKPQTSQQQQQAAPRRH